MAIENVSGYILMQNKQHTKSGNGISSLELVSQLTSKYEEQ